MLILPWLLGSGVTTAAIGDDEGAVDQDLLAQDIAPDVPAEDEITGDFIQDYISAETVLSDEGDGESVAWQDVVIGFASDDDLSGGAGTDLLNKAASEFDFWDRLEASADAGASALATAVSEDLDLLFADITENFEAPAADIQNIVDADAFDGVADIAAPIQTVSEAVAPLLTDVFEVAVEEAAVAVEDTVEDAEGQLGDAGGAIAEAGEAIGETVIDADASVAETLSNTLGILYDTFDGNPFEGAQTTAALAAEIASDASADADTIVQSEIASAIASGDAQTIEMIQDFVAGEDVILVEYAGANEPVIGLEDDGAGNARIVVDGRQVAVVAAAAAMVTQNDIQAVRMDIEAERA